jgi:predicted deacylase
VTFPQTLLNDSLVTAITDDASAIQLRVHTFSASHPGPRLLLLGAVHGNETCGTQALTRLVDDLERGDVSLARGSVTVVPIANPLAYDRGERQADRNLNRSMGVRAAPVHYEDRVANALCPLLAAHDVLVDLHSFHSPGEPFIMLGPRDNAGVIEPFSRAADEERLAAHLGPTRVVEGWMRAYALGVDRRLTSETSADDRARILSYGVGTTEFVRRCGGAALTVECGQHNDPRAPEVAYRAAMQSLRVLGLVETPLEPPASDFEVLELVEVVDRVHPADRLAKAWKTFDSFDVGEVLATRASGEHCVAPSRGRIVFPNPDAVPGTEWFYRAAVSERKLRVYL